MANAMTLDDFLGHKTSEGGDSNYLRWNKRNPPAVDVWLHTRAGIVSLWQHNFPRIVDRKDETTGATHQEVWGGSWNCWEHENVLIRQNFREAGERKFPPTICPFCMMIEAIRKLVDSGKISWIDPIFKFEVGDKHDRVIHAGGIYNAYAKQGLSAEELKELKDNRIYRTETWMENGKAKCSYVLAVVDNDNVDKGVLISVEGAGLGDKLKIAIKQKQKSAGPEKGNPIINPYAIRFEHHPDEAELSKKYEAFPMDSIALTPEVHRLITETNPPDTSKLTMLGNPKLLRGRIEAHWCGPDMDWDEIFGPVMEKFDDSEDDPASFPFGENDDEEASGESIPEVSSSADDNESVDEESGDDNDEATFDSDGVEIVECSNPACEKDMRITDDVCPHCGAVYDDDGNWSMPVKKKRSRKAAASAKKSESKPSKATSKSKPKDSNKDWGLDDPDSNPGGIPF